MQKQQSARHPALTEEIRIPDHLAGNHWVKIAFQAIWECLLWVVFCLSQFYHLTGSS